MGNLTNDLRELEGKLEYLAENLPPGNAEPRLALRVAAMNVILARWLVENVENSDDRNPDHTSDQAHRS